MVVFSVSALTSFLRPKLCTQNLSFFFLSCLRVFPRCNRARVCARSRETEYKLKSRLFFFLFFFVVQRRFFRCRYPTSRGRKGQMAERERDLVTENEAQTFVHFHITTNNEKKKYTKQANELLFFTRRSFFSTSRKRSFSPRRISLRRLCTRRDPTSRRRVLPCQNRSCLDETFRSFFSPLFVCRLKVERTGFSIWFSRR